MFKDSAGTQWEVKLTIGACDRIKALTEVDLLDDDGIKPLMDNPRLTIAVLAATIKPLLDAKGITPEAFLDLLDADAMSAGIDALWEAIVNFTRPEFRATRAKLVEKMKEANQLQADRETARLGKVDQLVKAELDSQDRQINERVEKQIAKLSGAQPAEAT